MNEEMRMRLLKISLVAFGAILALVVYPFFQYWPSGWRWGEGAPYYEQMIVGVYSTLGIFMIIAARDPMKHLSLIWFVVWSSIVHGGIMVVQAVMDTAERGHFIGDIPALFLTAAVLGFLTPRRIPA